MVATSSIKDSIFSQTSPGNIFLKFLNLNELPKGNISSPFSDDKKASFRIYKNGTFKCFSTGKQGDAFQLVAELNNLDCKKQFNDVAKIIVEELKIPIKNTESFFAKNQKNEQKPLKLGDLGVQPKKNNTTGFLQNSNFTDGKQDSFKVSVTSKEMTETDYQFWLSIGVEKSLLQKYSVSSVKEFSFYSEKKGKDVDWKIYDYLAFSYEVNGNFEVYIPKQPLKKREKFFCNGLQKTDIFGFAQLPKENIENLVICAGKKDAIVCASRGFHSVSFRSENHLPSEDQIKTLKNRCSSLYLCYDNDNGGASGSKKITSNFTDIIQISLPEEINDLTDYFQEYSKEDFRNLLTAAKEKKNILQKTDLTTIFHVAEDYLKEHYEFRYNSISLAIESTKKDAKDWTVCNEDSLWLELQKKSIKIPMNSLLSILKSDFVTVYNPLQDYFKNLKEWDKKTDFIQQYSSYIILEESESRDQFEYHFKKWCVRAVKCAIIENYYNKQAFILTDDGLGQDIGKTSYCRFLCPPKLTDYIAQDIPENEKDARVLFAKNFLVNLDELASLSRKEINKLKSYFTLDKINERLPYDRKNSIIPRVASFIGSTNMSTFLQDETGSVRWLCFIVKSIDWNYRKTFDIDNLWAQAFALSNDPSFESEMNREDIKKNELRNEKFQIVSPESDLIREYIEKAKNIENAEFLTPTAILQYLNLQSPGVRLTNVGIGKALISNGFIRTKRNGIYGYWIKKKISINTNVDI